MDVDFKNSEFEHLTNTEALTKVCEIAGSTTNTKLQFTEFKISEQNKRFYFPCIRWPSC